MKLRTLAAALAISTSLSSFAIAQDRLAGHVRLEGFAPALSTDAPNPNRALFGGPVKLNELTLNALAKVAPAPTWTTPVNPRVTFIWTVKEPGKYALAGATDQPWGHGWKDGGCLVRTTINGQPTGIKAFSKTGDDINFGEAIELKAGDYEVAIAFICRRDRIGVESIQFRPVEQPISIDIFVRSQRGIRRLKADEISTIADAGSTAAVAAETSEAKPRVLRPGVKREAAPMIAGDAASGWVAEYRRMKNPDIFGNRLAEIEKQMAYEPNNALSLPANGGAFRTMAKGALGNNDYALLSFETNLIVKEPGATPTWLALVLEDRAGGAINRCWSNLTVEEKQIENFSLAEWQSRNGATVSRGTGFVGLFDLPVMQPGAYKIRAELACTNHDYETSNANLTFMLKRPGEAALRPAVAGDFVTEKKGN